MHRDIKCANILISVRGECKLADFNVSKVVSSEKGLLHTQTGTPYYASPEVWKDRPYDFKSDVWSLGVVLYEMASLRPPFRAGDMCGLYKKVISANYPPIPNRYSNELGEVLAMMMQPNPNLRLNVDELLASNIVKERIKKLRDFDINIDRCTNLLSFATKSVSSTDSSQLNIFSTKPTRGNSVTKYDSFGGA